jgi:hypothetical protein
MSETPSSEMGFGLALLFGALAVLGALASTATSYLYAMAGDHLMQTASGVTIALSLLFGSLTIAVLHRYGE